LLSIIIVIKYLKVDNPMNKIKGPTIEVTPPGYDIFTCWMWRIQGEGNNTHSYFHVSSIPDFTERNDDYGLVQRIHVSNFGKEIKTVLGIIRPDEYGNKDVLEKLANCTRKDAIIFAEKYNSRVEEVDESGNLIAVLRE